MHFPAPPRPARPPGTGGRPPRHGAVLKLSDPQTWPAPAVTTITQTTRYGTAAAAAWGRLHQRLASRGGWQSHDGELPVIEGTLIRLQVEHLPGDRSPEPLWLWSSRAGADPAAVDRTWQSFLRRFDIEHMFRFLKQVLGWTRPRLRDPAAADRWTWLILACYAQLWLARGLAEDLRLPWQRAGPAQQADPRPGPERVPEHPPGAARSGRRAETRQTRPRPPARIEEPPPGHPPRRGQDRQARPAREGNPQAEGLNNKLRRRARCVPDRPAPLAARCYRGNCQRLKTPRTSRSSL